MENLTGIEDLKRILSTPTNHLTHAEKERMALFFVKEWKNRTPEEHAIVTAWVAEREKAFREAPTFRVVDGLELSTKSIFRDFLGFKTEAELSGQPLDIVRPDIHSTDDLMQNILDIFNRDRSVFALTSEVLSEEEIKSSMEFSILESGEKHREEVESIYRGMKQRPGMEFWDLLCGMLATCVADREALKRGFVNFWMPFLERMSFSIRVHVGSDGSISKKYLPKSLLEPKEMLALIALMLVDNSLHYGRDLCKCKREVCGRLFMATQSPRGGPIRRTYCSDPCMLAENKRLASKRAAESRKDRKAKPKTQAPRRRRHK